MNLVENITAQEPPKNVLLDTCKIALGEIRIDQRAQPRDHLNTEITDAYAADMREGAIFPSLTVFFDGDAYWLADGFHRHYAAFVVGLKEIRCDVREGGLREAVLFSCGANGSHGHRRSNDDKRRAVRRMLEDDEWRRWSDSEISRRCHVTQPFVGKVRQEMSPITVLSEPASNGVAADQTAGHRTYTTKHGTTSSMDTASIGKSNGTARRGPRVNVPDDQSLSGMIRRGLELEASGANAEGAAKQLGVDRKAYRQARDVVLLADRLDLNEADSALAREAQAELDDARQTGTAHDKIKHIVKRIWGAQGSRRNDAREAQRFEAFEDAITIIVDACDKGQEISIPHLSREQADSTIKKLRRAEAGLRVLKTKVEETQQ